MTGLDRKDNRYHSPCGCDWVLDTARLIDPCEEHAEAFAECDTVALPTALDIIVFYQTEPIVNQLREVVASR